MKKFFLILPLMTLSFSCSQEGELTRDEVQNINIINNDGEDTSSNNNNNNNNTNTRYTGKFISTSGHSVKGEAIIFSENNVSKLNFQNFSVTNGPDLKVYLSKTNSPTSIVNLGNLRDNMTYTIPSQVNLTEYKYVLIHCQQYNQLFAYAELTSK